MNRENLHHDDAAQMGSLLDELMSSSSTAPAAPARKPKKGKVSQFRREQRENPPSPPAAKAAQPAPREKKKKRKGPRDDNPNRAALRCADVPAPAAPAAPDPGLESLLDEMAAGAPPATKKRKKQRPPSAAAAARAAAAAFVACRAAALRGDGAGAAALARTLADRCTALLEAAPSEEAAECRGLAGDAARVAAGRAAALAARDVSAAVAVFAAFDAVYFKLRYVAVVRGFGDAVPRPHDVFDALLVAPSKALAADAPREAVAAAAARALDAVEAAGGGALVEAWALRGGGGNALLRLFRARWREVAWLSRDWTVPEAPLVPSPEAAATMKGADPVAPAWLHAARRAATASCHEYAYAVPSDGALDALAAVGPLVEIGAGTGYWASCLRERGVAVEAFDVAPPGDGANAYHGRSKAWTAVKRGGVAEAVAAATRGARRATLFACYPPPGEREAYLGAAAAAFHDGGGETLALVGEWRGDTATAGDLLALRARFALAARVALPNYGDGSAELTIWTRRGGAAAPSVAPPDACDACGARGPVRRCRLTCDVAYCSAACATAAGAKRGQLLALKCAPASSPADFGDPLHFADLGPLAAAAPKKRRAKKKKRR